MRCNEFYDALSLYFDGELDEAGINEMLDHIRECDECRKAYEDYEKLKTIFESIDDEPLPENGHEKIMSAVRNAGKQPGSKLGKTAFKFNKKFAGIAAVVVVVILVGFAAANGFFRAGSSAPKYAADSAMSEGAYDYKSAAVYDEPMESNAMPQEAPMAMEDAVETEEAVTFDEEARESVSSLNENTAADTAVEESAKESSSDRLIIRDLYARIEVENYDETVSKLENIAKAYGGYVQDSSVWEDTYDNEYSVKNGEVVLRIPKEHYETVKNGISALGKVYEENESSTDVTAQYVDTEGRLKALRTEQDRLMEILEKCETVEDLITVEERLSEVRADIEVYQNMLNNWDRLVQLSTFRISISEKVPAKVHTKLGFGDRMSDEFVYGLNNFIEGWQNFAVWLAGSFLAIIVIIVIIIIIIKIVKWRLRKRKEKMENMYKE